MTLSPPSNPAESSLASDQNGQSDYRICALVPTYNNPATIGPVVDRIRGLLPDVIVVDDGSSAEGRAACEAVAQLPGVDLVQRPQNGGKGAAVKSGFARASECGFTHVFQIDADGQHEIEAIPRFVEVSQQNPRKLVLASPVYDESVSKVRLRARKITRFWVNFEVGGQGIIEDAMVGFRVYPLGAVRDLNVKSDRMDFDVEIAVRIVWSGVSVENLPVKVRYLTEEEGGTSHFQPFRDNVRISWLHSKLCTAKICGWFWRRLVPLK